MTMTDVTEIKTAITQLPPREVTELRKWFDRWEDEVWNCQIEADIQAKQSDIPADQGIRATETGDYREL